MTVHPYPRPVAGPPPGYDPAGDPADDQLFDWQRVHRYLRFALRSIGRRKWLFAGIWATMVLVAGAALWALPRTYEVETRILAQKNAVLAVRADANAWETPIRSAADTVMSRENLHSLIRQTELLTEWNKRRAPAARFKDWALSKLRRPPTQEERLAALTGLLEKQMTVWTSQDGTVAIRIHWPDPVMAYRLVDAAQQNYLETRHAAEISTIAEQIAILESHAAKLKGDVEKSLAELQRLRGAKVPLQSRAFTSAPGADESPEVINLRVMLEAKRRAIADLEQFRRHHLAEQQTRLAELAAVYSDSHPVIVDLRQSIAALQNDSPQLRSLRQEEADLREQLGKHGERGEAAVSAALGARELPIPPPGPNDDPTVDYARTQLQFASVQYAQIRDRITTARLDLDTARAAFKHRYSVVVPAELPRGPIKPNALLVMVAAAVVGLLLAIFGATSLDLRSGAVLEKWQLQDLLGPSRAIIELRLP